MSGRGMLGLRGVLAGAALLAACAPAARPPEGSATDADVLVIGAGMAGLGAARGALEAGRSVIVIEARDRIGGRAWTDRTSMGVPIERGAELVHGADASTWDFMKKAGIETQKWDTIVSRYSPATPWVSSFDWGWYSFPEGRPAIAVPVPEPFADETAAAFLARLGISPSNFPLALHRAAVASAHLENLPAGAVVEELETALTAPDSGAIPMGDYADFRKLGGYDTVANLMAEGVDIRLGRTVTSISYSATGVEVEAGGKTFRGKTAVVALPAGVLQSGSVTFDPPLPDTTTSLINDIVYLPVYKGLLEFAAPVLPEPWDMVDDFSRTPPSLWDSARGTAGYSGQVLVAWACGDEAREVLALSEAERLEASLETVRTIAGDSSITPIATSTYDWSTDPLALGAYPMKHPDPAELYVPIKDALFWAGMHTSSVDWSYDTGIEAGRAAAAAA